MSKDEKRLLILVALAELEGLERLHLLSYSRSGREFWVVRFQFENNVLGFAGMKKIADLVSSSGRELRLSVGVGDGLNFELRGRGDPSGCLPLIEMVREKYCRVFAADLLTPRASTRAEAITKKTSKNERVRNRKAATNWAKRETIISMGTPSPSSFPR